MFRNPAVDAIVVLIIVLLIFGPKRLPLLGRQLGQGLREFKDSITGDNKDEAEERPELTASTPSAYTPPASTAQTPSAAPAPAPERQASEVTPEHRS